MKDKFEFIEKLLLEPKLNTQDKERVFKLLVPELKINNSPSHEKSPNIVEDKKVKIENSNPLNIIGDSIQEIENLSLINYQNPENLFKFLFNYNQNKILKSTCHEIDENELSTILKYTKSENYDFEKHLKFILDEFKKHEKKYVCTHKMKSLIRGYLTGKDFEKNEIKGWSTDEIKMNWSDKELKKWSIQNNVPPNLIQEELDNREIVPFNLNPNLSPRNFNLTIQNFRELTLHFKNLFHIKFPNTLKSLIENLNKENEYNNKIDFVINEKHFSNYIELFTDVDKLLQAYKIIIKLILECNKNENIKPEVKLSFFENSNKIYLSIHNTNNDYNKSLNATILRLGQTYTNIIKNQLNGMCNFYLKAEFKNEGNFKVNIWDEKERSSTPLDTNCFSGGVEHLIEFIKKV